MQGVWGGLWAQHLQHGLTLSNSVLNPQKTTVSLQLLCCKTSTNKQTNKTGHRSRTRSSPGCGVLKLYPNSFSSASTAGPRRAAGGPLVWRPTPTMTLTHSCRCFVSAASCCGSVCIISCTCSPAKDAESSRSTTTGQQLCSEPANASPSSLQEQSNDHCCLCQQSNDHCCLCKKAKPLLRP